MMIQLIESNNKKIIRKETIFFLKGTRKEGRLKEKLWGHGHEEPFHFFFPLLHSVIYYS